MARFSTCRFCDNWRDQEMVQYGTRHYAHFKCYLDKGKKLKDLHGWQVSEFPYLLLKERGLLQEAMELTKDEETIRFRVRQDDHFGE
jgi:hypothetical protein